MPVQVLESVWERKKWYWNSNLQQPQCCWGAPPEIRHHLYSFEHVKLHVVLTTPEGQLFNLLSVCRLFTVPDEANDRCADCKSQKFNRWVSWGAVVGVEGEEQWGEHTPLGRGCQCWLSGSWMWCSLTSPAASCLPGSLWSTDRWWLAQWAAWVWSGGFLEWWC